VVFTSTRSGVHELWVLDVESGRVRQLTFGSEARLAAWSRALVP
jgi:Tol biopolymer transport system component